MATPVLYSRYAAAFRSVWAKYRRVLLAFIIVVAFTPAVLERGFSFGLAPGRMLFVFMLAYFAAVTPVLAFRGQLPSQPWSIRAASWAWLKAFACTAFGIACVWAIFAGLRGNAV